MSAILELVGLLANLESAFATGARYTCPKQAKLRINTLELLPLTASKLNRLRGLAQPAPYGKADKTIIDPEVRAAMQVDASLITESSQWRMIINDLVDDLKYDLAIDGEVVAELYKLLIYEPGGHFKPHRDSEKAAGMFGTLIITLPTEFEGGELVVEHAQEKKRFKLRSKKSDELCWAAFYADCIHELEPVTSGCRVSLVYNLTSRATTTPAPLELAVQLTSVLQRWQKEPHREHKIAHLLTHKYTARGFGPAQLKGYDAQMAQALTQACERAGFELIVALLNIQDFGSYYGDDEEMDEYEEDWDEELWGEYEEDEDEDEEEDVDALPLDEMEHSHYECVVERCYSLSGGATPPLNLAPNEFTSLELLSELEPDEKSFEGYTGNEGNSYELRYRVGALVMWPK